MFFSASVMLKWDLSSMIFYIILGLIAVVCLHNSQKKYSSSNKWLLKDKYLSWWFLIWVTAAVLRYVHSPIGGRDASNYATYFEICRNNIMPPYFEHFAGDILFKYFNQTIRLFTSEYHIYFFIAYGIICYVMIDFCRRFSPSKINYIPFLLLFYWYLLSFNTLRSHLAIVVILIACILLLKGRNKEAIIVALCSGLVHKAGLLYAMCIPFCIIFLKRELTFKLFLILMTISIVASTALQEFFILYTSDMELSGAYNAYATQAVGSSFLENAWKIAFEQLVLAAFLLLSFKKFKAFRDVLPDQERHKVQIVYLICLFDFLLIPVNHVLNIWRGYEFFYIPRLIMWGILISVFLQRKSLKYMQIYSFLILICFVSWMIFRVWNTWEATGLMPYVFEPFLYM